MTEVKNDTADPEGQASDSTVPAKPKATKAKRDLDAPKPGWPKGALLVVIVPSALFLIFDGGLNGVPFPLVIVAHVLPIVAVVLLGRHIKRTPNHTARDKRRLWMFILACYVVGLGLLLITNGGQGFHVKGTGEETIEDWEMGAGMPILWVALPILFIGLMLVLVLLTGKGLREAPVQYSGFLLGVALFFILMVPYVNQNVLIFATDTWWGWPAFEPVPGPGEEVRMWGVTRYLHGSFGAGESGGVYRDDFDESFLQIEMALGIMAMIFASLWSLNRPETYETTFGLREPKEDDGDEPKDEPEDNEDDNEAQAPDSDESVIATAD
jgi:hypothetical protein